VNLCLCVNGHFMQSELFVWGVILFTLAIMAYIKLLLLVIVILKDRKIH
jgi:hypothetical protein